MTVVGDMDPTVVAKQLRKIGNAEIVSSGSTNLFLHSCSNHSSVLVYHPQYVYLEEYLINHDDG